MMRDMLNSSSHFSSSSTGVVKVKRGAWTETEDTLLKQCIGKYGEGNWYRIPERAGLNRCRKSCRLRWLNYLHPDIKRGEFSLEEINLIIKMHNLLGNRWSLIAGRLPGRTANDIKNHWNTHINNKKLFSSSRHINNKKLFSSSRQNMINPVLKITETITPKTKPVKPRPHRLSKNFQSEAKNITITNLHDETTVVESAELPIKNSSTTTLLEFKQDQRMEWRNSFLFQDQDDENETLSITTFGEDFISAYLGDGHELAKRSEVESTMEVESNDDCLDFDISELM